MSMRLTAHRLSNPLAELPTRCANSSNAPIALPALPSQIAVDGLGDVFTTSPSAGAIDELA